MVSTRHFSNIVFVVDEVFFTNIGSLEGVIKYQADKLTKLPVRILENELPVKNYDVIIDGIIGYSLNGEVSQEVL